MARRLNKEKLADGRIKVRSAASRGKISDAFGFLKRADGPRLSIDEVNKIVAKGWVGEL